MRLFARFAQWADPKTLLRAAAVVLAYYASARLGLLMAFEPSNVTPVWPPSGIAVAALLLLGVRYWPALLLAVFCTEVSTGLAPPVAAGLALGNTLEYVLAAFLLQRFGFDGGLRRIRDVIALAVLGSVVSPIVAATVGTASLWLGGVVPSADVRTVWTTYLVGDGVGILVFTPVVLVWGRRGRRAGTLVASRAGEAALLTCIIVASGISVFSGASKFAYPIFPLAIWAALRFGQRGATLTTLAVSCLALWGTVHGLGPFAQNPPAVRIADLDLYLGAFGFTGLLLAASVLSGRDAENKVMVHVAELEAMNRELDAFAYTVAHDLRAPLRAIDGFSIALKEDYAEVLPADAQRLLDRVAGNAQQLGRLIDALLNFSRLGARKLAREELFPRPIALRAFEIVRGSAAGPRVELTVGDLRTCSADAELLSVVYQNLLGNALKFTRDRELAKIDVGCLPTLAAPDTAVYYVRDNGAGFDMRHSDQLFGVFSRLHRPDEFPGTGAGLATVKRIVTKHGGRIWADAEPNAGATFFFTLAPEAS